MREILFRGRFKCDYHSHWVEGIGVRMYEEGSSVLYTGDGDRRCLVDTESVGQFTGRTDKHGKKIFEGDIVKTKYGRLCIVVWFSSSAHCGWDLKPTGSAENCIHTKAPDRSDLYNSCNLEVIGNVHENPELLEGERS